MTGRSQLERIWSAPVPRRLGQAVDDLDQSTSGRLVVESLQAHGVVMTWTDLIAPAPQRIGERFACTGEASRNRQGA